MLSVFLAFIFPGLGHFASGVYKKGIYFFLLALLSLFVPIAGIFIFIFLYIGSIKDISIKKSIKKRQAFAAFKYFFIMCVVLSTVATMLSIRIENFDRSKKNFKITLKKLETIVLLVDIYYKNHNKFPDSISEILGVSPLEKRKIFDAWGNKFFIKNYENEVFCLCSKGKDGLADSDDDIFQCLLKK